MKHAPGFLRLVAECMPRIQEIDIDHVRSQPALTLVDVREDHEWAAGHIPGAIHLGRGILERDVEQRIPDLHAPIVLYCGGGYRSALAADNLQKMGYTQVYSMAGGWRAWREAGLPAVTPDP